MCHVRIQRAGRETGPPPPENDKNIGFLSNSGPDPLKNNKSSKRAFNVLCMAIIAPQVKRPLNGVSLAGRYWPALNGIWILSPSKKTNIDRVASPLTKLIGSAHVC